ncbi:hypothetical protein [Streptomyces sp. NBC_01304]|uniref:hypothetical protein n=1 Tax=Streptomyces sp. NBC_01304 TaxID=2903818 RepID=UPI002E159191|nr:hypothetical protein OG430_49295 [Streptomyces sp. NBC_01304]
MPEADVAAAGQGTLPYIEEKSIRPRLVDQAMDALPTTAAPGVAERAEALADAACELHDAATSPDRWSAAAVEDAVESVETTLLALLTLHPGAALVGQAVTQLRDDLGLPPRDASKAGPVAAEDQLTEPTPIRARRERRGLGPGFQGVRIPGTRTGSGR